MTLEILALQTIQALNLVPPENVEINNVIDPDWDGTAKIMVSVTETTVQDESQFGAVSHSVPLAIYCIAADRQTAQMLCKQAADAVYAAVETQERQGFVLAILKKEMTILPLPDRSEYKAGAVFEVLTV